jgi:broad-specificity NMP kinase
MGIKNYLIEGVSGTGKTAVAEELERRGCHVIHGDRVLAYYGDPQTGDALAMPLFENERDKVAWIYAHWIWPVDTVKTLIADHRNTATFFCGTSRNTHAFIDLFDEIFVLEVKLETLKQRLANRPEDEFGGRPAEQELIARLHATKEDVPKQGEVVKAEMSPSQVVDEIVKKCGERCQFWVRKN